MKAVIIIVLFLNTLSVYADSGNPISDLLDRTYHISVKGDYLFASSTAGLTVYRVTEGKPVQISYLVAENSGTSTLIDGDSLYLFAGNSGVYKIDIRDPQKPVITGNIKLLGSAINGDIYRDKLYVSLGSTGFAVIKREDLTPIKYFDMQSYCSFVKIVDSSLFVSTEQNGLYIYNLNNLKLSHNITIKRRIRDIQSDKNFVFLANDTEGLIVLKKEKNKYSLFKSYDTPDTARGIALYKEYIFVADGNTGVIVLKYDGSNLFKIKDFNTNYSANKVVVSGDNLIISNDAAGVMVVNIGDLIK